MTGVQTCALPISNPADRGDRPQPIVVTILANRDDIPLILVNSKKVQWDNLQEVASEKLGLLAERRAYIEADESVRWAYVVEVVDMLEKLHCRAVLLTSTPAHKSCVRAMRFSIAEAAPLR